MGFHNEKQIQHTKKVHKCEGCLNIIPAGSSARYYAGVKNGEFYNYYLCPICQDFMDEHSEWVLDNGWFNTGDVAVGRMEYEKSQTAE